MRLDLVFVSVCIALIAGSAGRSPIRRSARRAFCHAHDDCGAGAAPASTICCRCALRCASLLRTSRLIFCASPPHVRQEAARQDALRQEMRQEIRSGPWRRQVTQVERDPRGARAAGRRHD